MASTKAERARITRRAFVGAAAAATAGWAIIPRRVLGGAGQTPPSERLNLAGIGVGGQGGGDLQQIARAGDDTVHVLALCDADDQRAAESVQRFPDARRYRDYRQMFSELADRIDAVLVATPDHTHAVAAMTAIKAGKHVYCEKPLAHSVWEVRELVKAAAEKGVVTQLGNQGHASGDIRKFCEWVWDGAIGNVHTVHAACASSYSKIDNLPRLAEKHEVPPTLDWDLWLGPAQHRPYHPMYVPGQWRGWMPFGTGVVGDWTCHVIDPVFWALDLGAPASVVTKAEGYDPVKHADTFPNGSKIRYEFPTRGDRGPVTLYWYDGLEKIPPPEGIGPGDGRRRGTPRTGAVVLGDKGGIAYGSHGAGGVRLFPEEKMAAYKQPPPKLPRVRGHHHDWLAAIREGRKAGSDFAYGGPLTELALLGVIATRLLGRELKWDGPAGRFTNSDEANRMLKPTFREGWSL